MALTPKQEAFCRAYIETGNASEAYRRAYDAEGMKPETVNRKATELLANGTITARVAEFHAEVRESFDITLDALLRELEHARQVAKERGNASAMVTATMGKARLTGLDKPAETQASPEEVAAKVRAFVAGIDAATLTSPVLTFSQVERLAALGITPKGGRLIVPDPVSPEAWAAQAQAQQAELMSKRH